LEPDGPSGKSALTFLRTKVPRHPVPMMAVDGNIQGFNQMAAGEHEAARETFERLIGDYPTFEWPYGNLGSLLLYLGEPERARKVLEKALEINPFYLNAMLHLARVHAVMENHDEALKLLDSAASIDPSDVRVSQIRDTVANSQ
jgi:tetratricopeptide (TPR) repeat protein